jgi:uncharacterized protein with NRDE domain
MRIAANRDEYPRARRLEPAHWWDESVLSRFDFVACGS